MVRSLRQNGRTYYGTGSSRQRHDDGVEFGECVEVAVDDWLVDVAPQGLGWLQLRRVGRQMNEADALGDRARRAVPARAVKDEDDDAVTAGAGLAGEQREGVLEQFLVDAGREIPEALAGGRRDEGGDVEPAAMAAGDVALAARCPDPAQDRLQPDAVLVGGEGLDCRAGTALGLLGDDFREFFLTPPVARASPPARAAAAGAFGGLARPHLRPRFRLTVQPIARKASQPRCSAMPASPSVAAITAATFFAVQTPPSSGGLFTRSRSIARISGVRMRGSPSPIP